MSSGNGHFVIIVQESCKEWQTISTNELKGNIGNNVQNISEIGTGEAAMS